MLLCAWLLVACARPTATFTPTPSPTPTTTPTATTTATPTPTATATPIPEYTLNLQPAEIEDARQTWDKQKLRGYQIRLVAGPPFHFYIFTVVQGNATNAHRSRYPLEVALDDLPDALSGAKMTPYYNLRDLARLTVDGLFQQIMAYLSSRPTSPPCDTHVTVDLDSDYAFPRRIVERWSDDCSGSAEPAWVDVVQFVTLTPLPTATGTPTPTPTPTRTPTLTPTNTATPTRDPSVSIERRSIGNGWDALEHTGVGYTLNLPDSWRDFDPGVERALATQRAREVSACFEALLNSLLAENVGVDFSLLAFDESLLIPDETGIPASLAVGHAKAPAPIPITFLLSEFTRQMNAIEGVTVVQADNRPKINGLSAAQLTLRIDSLCDAAGQLVPTTGYQIYIAEGSDIHILTFIAPDAVFVNYQVRFDDIAASFQRAN